MKKYTKRHLPFKVSLLNDKENLLNIDELATKCNVTNATIRKWIRSGFINPKYVYKKINGFDFFFENQQTSAVINSFEKHRYYLISEHAFEELANKHSIHKIKYMDAYWFNYWLLKNGTKNDQKILKPHKYYTTQEAVDKLGISIKTLTRWGDANLIPRRLISVHKNYKKRHYKWGQEYVDALVDWIKPNTIYKKYKKG